MADKERKDNRVAIVIGVTGIIGNSLARKLLDNHGFSKVYGTGRRECPKWLPTEVNYIQVDLLNREQVQQLLSPLRKSITDLFWAAWIPMPTEAENCDANGSILRNTLDALIGDDHSSSLHHISLTTGAKHYVGPFEQFGKELQLPDAPFVEDTPRLSVPNFYYVQEDILFEAAKNNPLITYSIHRPSFVFGFAPRNYMNCLAALAVYAVVCKHENIPFEFPGSPATWNVLNDMSDADLIAEQEIWAANEKQAKNKSFNITNGDVFKWKRIWTVIAEEMGVEPAPYKEKSFSLREMMEGKETVWDEIVKEKNLLPTKLQEVGQFWFVDVCFGRDLAVECVMDMNRSKECGFLGFRNSEKSVRYWIAKLKAEKIVP